MCSISGLKMFPLEIYQRLSHSKSCGIMLMQILDIQKYIFRLKMKLTAKSLILIHNEYIGLLSKVKT